MTDTSGESPSLRERNRQATRQSIIDACAAITREHGDADFTMPHVAERSGVALRTLYRYFPTRQDLVDALATVADQVDVAAPPESLDQLEAWLRQAWTNLLAEQALLRAQHFGAAGAEVRKARAIGHAAVADRLVRAVRPDLSAKQRKLLIPSIMLLSSSTALFEFIDVHELSVDAGAQAAATAIKILVESA